MKKYILLIQILIVLFLSDSQAQTIFNYTGAVQYYVVPACVTSVNVDVKGAQGGANAAGVQGGFGGQSTGIMSVSAGDTLYVYVGGSNGYNGGGTAGTSGCAGAVGGNGGGASDIRIGNTMLTSRVVVGAGGGGAGGNRAAGCGRGTGGGGGGGYYGGGGGAGWPSTSVILPTGGDQLTGGIGGQSDLATVPNNDGYPGLFGQGGGGGNEVTSSQGSSQTGSGGGFGGGFTGNNGNYAGNFTGQSGAGGSSYIGGVALGNTYTGIRSGNGEVIITPVIPAPAEPDTIIGATSVCIGDTGTIYSIAMVPSATSYIWSVPAGYTITSGQGTTSITLNAGSLTDTITVAAANACGTSATAMLIITVNSLPTIFASAVSGSICLGENDTVIAAGGNSYVWNTSNINDSIIVFPTNTTTYTVTGTDGNGCVNTSSITVNVNPLPIVSLGADSAYCDSHTINAQNPGSTYLWNDSTTAQTIVVSSPGNYHVTVTDLNGCSNSDSVYIMIYTLPVINAIATQPSICFGSSDTLTATGGISYVWSTSDITDTIFIAPVSTNTYTVTGTDMNGCSNTSSVTITVNLLPTVNASVSLPIVCLSYADVILIGTPAGGTWSGPGVTGSQFDPSVGVGNQLLIYNYTDGFGCSNADSASVTVNACLEIENSVLLSNSNVYPNPNNGMFTLNVNAEVGDLTIHITDINGRMVHQFIEKNIQAGFQKNILIENGSAGIYFVHLIAGNQNKTLKMVIE
jgi:hypothetical protein